MNRGIAWFSLSEMYREGRRREMEGGLNLGPLSCSAGMEGYVRHSSSGTG